MRSRLIYKDKFTDGERNLLEMVIWEVSRTESYPQGIRYRLVFVPFGAIQPAVLYDNHHPKGHHKHIVDAEEAYYFSNLEQLQKDFLEDVARWKRKRIDIQ